MTSLSVLRLDVSIDPTEEMVDEISKWVCGNMGEGILLEFNVDSNILGGAKISYQGKYVDLSLQQVWSEEWKRVWQSMISSKRR